MNVLTAHCRPHLADEHCWCKPLVRTCDCDESHGYLLHRQLDVRPDSQHRMAVFSDQFYEIRPSIGVVI